MDDPKKLGLKKLLEQGNIEKFLEISEQQSQTKARQEFNDLIKPFSMLGDVIARHAKGVFVEEVLENVKTIAGNIEDALSLSLKEEAKTLRTELAAVMSEKDANTRQAAIAEVERKAAGIEKRVTKAMTEKAVAEMNRLLPQIAKDAKLTADEVQEITDNAALSVESQLDGIIAAYISDTAFDADQIKGLKSFIEAQIPEVDFSKAIIDWRQIKNVPNLSGGGAGARTLYWLNDVDLSTAPTNGQALVYNSTTQKWEPGNVDSLPTQTGNSGKFLTTDGTDASWATLAGGGDMAAATYDPNTVSGDAFLMTNMNGTAHRLFYTNGTGDVTELGFGTSGQYLKSNGATSAPAFADVTATVAAINDIGDVTITTPADNEVLAYDSGSGDFINQTAAEAGLAAASHNHATTDITSGTFADARIAQSNVTQHQAALSITESQISDLGSYLTSVAINDISDITITTPADNEVLAYNGAGAWINQTAAEAGLQPTLAEGAFVDGDKTKLDGIEASADVTDTANVTAAGALMDSEVTDLAGIKSLDTSTLVVGPASATDNAVARFDSTTGKLIQNSGATLDDTGKLTLTNIDATGATASVQGLRIEGDATNAISFSTFVTGDAQLRFNFSPTGQMLWGDGTSVADTNLYRDAANALKTDDSFEVGGTLTVGTLTGVLRADTGVVSVDSDVTDIVAAASTTTAGKVELATTAEVDTGTDTARAVTPDALADSKFGTSSLVSSINFVIDGGGSAITTGVKGYIEIPFACTINQVTLLADQSGSIVVDIWKDTYANYPPTDADSITASAVPTISTATKSQDATLTGWTTSVSAGDILGFNVDSATTVTRVTLSLKVTRT